MALALLYFQVLYKWYRSVDVISLSKKDQSILSFKGEALEKLTHNQGENP